MVLLIQMAKQSAQPVSLRRSLGRIYLIQSPRLRACARSEAVGQRAVKSEDERAMNDELILRGFAQGRAGAVEKE